MSDRNMQIVRRLLEEVWTQGNIALLPELLAESVVAHPMPQFHSLQGPTAYQEFLAVYKGTFHDMTFSIEDQFAEGHRVATRWVSRVTDESGDARQDSQTGEQLTIDGITITHHQEDGRIIAEWATWDTASLLQSAAAPQVLEQLSIRA